MNTDLQLVDRRTAAKILGISTRKLWSLTASGEIPCVKIGRAVRYDLRDLSEYVNKQKQKARKPWHGSAGDSQGRLDDGITTP